MVAKGVLGSYGIEVDTCLSGREAVERLRNVSYDVVFLDHMMPGFDGVETLKRIREINNGKYQDLPVIALTANTISGAREMFRNEGFTEFIPKPIERSVLERVLRRVLPRNCFQYGAEMISPPEAPAVEKEPEERAAKEDVPLKEASGRFAGLDKAGINEKMGLDYCCGEEEFYLEMLQMFGSQYEEKRAEIVSLYESADWADYAIKVHALKSTSLTIGAEQLSDSAKMLEQAGKKEDVEYIQKNHAALLDLYEKVCKSIGKI